MSNAYQPIRPSQWTAGRWRVGDGPDAHELSSGDIIEFKDGKVLRLGRVELARGRYIVIIPKKPKSSDADIKLVAELTHARYIGRGTLGESI